VGSRSSEEKEPARPLRWAPYPEPPSSGRTPYGRRNPELGDQTPLGRTEFYIHSKAWEEIARPRLKALDEKRDPRGRKPEWSAEEKEIILFYGRMCGIPATSIEKVRRSLMADRQAREVLGFAHARQGRRGRPVGIDDFLPKQGALRNHLRKLGDDGRKRLYEDLEEALLNEYCDLPEVREQMRLFHMDGLPVLTHFTAAIYRQGSRPEGTTGKPRHPVNEKLITAPDAGFMAARQSKPGGHGWKTVPITTNDGICVARATGRIQDEVAIAKEALDRFKERITPKLDAEKVNVLTADGLFNKGEIRRKCRAGEVAENIHHVSHSDKKKSKRRAASFARERLPIVHPSNPAYDNWFATKHREIVCKCGQGRVEKPASRRNGNVVLALVGRCENCGTIRIQSGRWRYAKTPKRFVLCQPGETDHADLSFGNGLTWGDARSKAYGHDRFGLQEGFFGTLRTLGLAEKTWFRRRAQVEIDLALVSGSLIATALEKHRRAALRPPGQLQAA
jgi:hypothetical protein